MGRTLAMSYRTRSQWYFQNQSIRRKSWLDMPFMNKWFEPEKKTYNGPAYRSASSWKLQPHLELTQMHQCNLQFWIMKLQKENYKQNVEVSIGMSDSGKMQYSKDWRTY